MRVVEIEGLSGRSSILVGERLENLSRHLPQGRVIIITDANLLRLYREELPPLPVLSIGCGETVKTLETVKDLYETLVDLEADRSTFILLKSPREWSLRQQCRYLTATPLSGYSTAVFCSTAAKPL